MWRHIIWCLSFPTHSIQVRSLMCMAYDTTREAMASSQEGAFSLCNSIQNMFELYCDVVPSYHREKLNNMPLLAGWLNVPNIGLSSLLSGSFPNVTILKYFDSPAPQQLYVCCPSPDYCGQDVSGEVEWSAPRQGVQTGRPGARGPQTGQWWLLTTHRS